MDIVEQLRKYQCPENKGCNPFVDYCQCALMDSGADEIERMQAAIKYILSARQNGITKDVESVLREALQQKESE